MTFRLLLLKLFCFVFMTTIGQNNQDKKPFFLNGIPIQNLKVEIPWGTTFNEINKYGDPKIFCSTSTNTIVKWNSVYVLDSIRVTFHAFYFKCFERKAPSGKLNTIYGSIDSTDIEKIKSIMNFYSGTEANLSKSKKVFSYYWNVDNCNVRVGFRKGTGAFFDIQTKDKSYWK